MRLRLLICCWAAGWCASLPAQDLPGSHVSGSFQTDVQYLFPDSIIGARSADETVLSNSYLQLSWSQGPLSAAIRYEAYLNPLLGFDPRYKGQGIAHRSASYRTERLEITAGHTYDQFGNGIIFRAYQEWALGIDNAVDGIRVLVRPVKGLSIKGLIGRQRRFFGYSEGLLRGGDLELDLNAAFKPLQDAKTRLTIGGSVMNRFQQDDDPRLLLPEQVSAFAARFRLLRGGFSLDGEYAYKINDPFQLNRYVYNPGSAWYASGAWTGKRFGLIVSGKRIDNMDFRSQRQVSLQEATLSFLPPISRLHTYRLPTLYPYATQLNGEVGFQASLYYNLPKNTPLGGKYGTQISVNYSRIHGLDTVFSEPGFRYASSFLGDWDKLYFEDLNIEINRKWTPKLRTILTYIHLKYNKDIIELGSPNAGFGIVDTHIGILEAQYRLKPKVSLRGEVQHMYTRQDLGSWVMALAEVSISPHWYLTLSDEYNYGNPDPARRVHYYFASAAYAFESTRIALTYSRQRRGLLCVGGICREVPASNGFGLSVASTF
ncbi:MAG: DUF6029 family protein [Bacteroidia bacterium]|nr:DUF6029 family protein [Bacteroidia bacterium]